MQQSEFAYPVQTQQMVPIRPGSVPQVPQMLVLPPHLVGYTGQAIFVMIAVIQNSATSNDLRKVFFNRISYNGYNNGFFQDICQRLSAMIDLATRANSNQDPGQVIDYVIDNFISYKVCQMGLTEPQLMQQLPPQYLQACQQTCGAFENMAQQWENAVRMNGGMGGMMPNNGGNMGRPNQPMQPPMGLMPNNMPGGMMPTNTFHSQQPSTTAPGQMQRGYGAPPAAFGQAPSRYSSAAETQAPPTPKWMQIPETPQRAPQQPRVTQTLDLYGGSNLTTFDQAESDTRVLQQTNVAPSAAPAQPTSTNPVKVAYDPNLFELVLDSSKKNYVLIQRSDMDRQKHLVRPRHAPVWLVPPTLGESDKRAEEMKQRSGDKITFLGEENSGFVICARLDEHWAGLQAQSQASQHKPAIEVGSIPAIEVKGVSAGEPARKYYAELQQVDDLVRMGTLVASALSNYRGRDQQLFGDLNDRLTEAVNFTLSCEMGVKGKISDFSGDIADLIAALSKAYGDGTVQTFIAQSVKIIKQSLSCIGEDDTSTRESIRAAYFHQLSDEEFGDLVIRDNITLINSVNVSSAELRLEFEDSDIGNSVFESKVPLAYAIIDACMKRKEAMMAHRVMLRTVDGVRFYISRSAFNPSGYQVMLLK